MRSVKILVKFLPLLQIHSDCLFLLDLVLVVCVFLGICPYHLSSFWTNSCLQYSLIIHFISVRSVVMSFVLNYDNLSLLFFSFGQSKGLSTVFIFSKNQLWFHWFFSFVFLFCSSVSFISTPILILPSFCFLWFSFLFFFIPQCKSLGYLFDIFPLFKGEH